MSDEKKTVGKSFTISEDILKEMLVDAGKITGGNFSKFILYLYEDWKKKHLSVQDDKIKQAIDFYDRFHENPQIVEYANKYGFGDIYSLFTLALSTYLDKNK